MLTSVQKVPLTFLILVLIRSSLAENGIELFLVITSEEEKLLGGKSLKINQMFRYYLNKYFVTSNFIFKPIAVIVGTFNL